MAFPLRLILEHILKYFQPLKMLVNSRNTLISLRNWHKTLKLSTLSHSQYVRICSEVSGLENIVYGVLFSFYNIFLVCEVTSVHDTAFGKLLLPQSATARESTAFFVQHSANHL